MCTIGDNGEIIILSDDDEEDGDEENDILCIEPSDLFVEAEDVKKSGNCITLYTCSMCFRL